MIKVSRNTRNIKNKKLFLVGQGTKNRVVKIRTTKELPYLGSAGYIRNANQINNRRKRINRSLDEAYRMIEEELK